MSWSKVKLAALCHKITDGSHNPPKGIDDSEYLMLSSKNIFHDEIHFKNPRFLSQQDFEQENKRTDVCVNDVLLTIVGTVGRVAVVLKEHPKFVLQRSVAVLKPIVDSATPRFLMYSLQSLSNVLTEKARGVAQKGIYLKQIRDLLIPLPPLAEQKKIAAILDAADKLRQKDQQLIAKYNALSQSLFLEMFGDPVANMKHWNVKELSEVSESQLGKMLSKKAKQNISPKKYLRNANVRWGSFELKDVLEMDFNEKECIKFNLLHGDLLVCEGGEVGRCAIWKNDLDDCYFQKALHRIRVNNNELTPEYLQKYFYWMSKLGGLIISTSEVTFSHLTAEKLKKLRVPVPPIALQEQFAERIQAIESQKQQAQASMQKSEELFNSLLQRAFKGELTC